MKRAAKLACMIAGAAAAALAFALSASADTSLTLTVEQTLALYGTQIQGLLRTERLGSQIPITFDYAFPLDSIGYMDDGGGFSPDNVYDCAMGYPNETARNEIASYFGNCNGLVYIASSSQWGGIDTTTYEDYNNPGVQLHCPFTISLSNIAGIQEGILFSSQNYTFSSVRNSYTSNKATWLFNDTDLVLDSLKGISYAGVVQPAVFSLPTYQYYSSVYDPDTGMTTHPGLELTQEQKFAGWYLNTDEQEENFSIRGLTIDAFGVQNQSACTDLWIIVCCPTLYAYEPPATTVPATTRREYTLAPPVSTAPAHTVDLSNLESGVAAIVQQGVEANNNLEWIGNNMYIGVNNLAYIAHRLDDIYAAMQHAGQIPVDATGELMSGVHSALTSYTTARIPDDASAGLTFWAWLMSKIMEVSFIAQLAALGAVLAVTYFILFRGRNS